MSSFGSVLSVRRAAACTVTLLCVTVCACSAAGASAENAGAGWELTARTLPTDLPPGGSGYIDVEIFNVGAGDSQGTITVTDTLPPGVTATDAGEAFQAFGRLEIKHSLWQCAGTTVVTCTNNPETFPSFAGGGAGFGGEGTFAGPYLTPQIGIAVKVAPGASASETNHVTIAGGGALTPASTIEPVTISSTPPPFGFAGWDAWFSNADGTLDTQAGSHPYLATFSFDLARVLSQGIWAPAGGKIRDLEVSLPPGLVGDPNAVPQCSRQVLDAEGACPPGSQIGWVQNTILGGVVLYQKVYNMIPPAGVPAEFAFTIEGTNVLLDSTVRTGSDYGITTHISDLPLRDIEASVLTLWGIPGDSSHDRFHGSEPGGCTKEQEGTPSCPLPGGSPKPLLTLPTSCAGTRPLAIRANSWENSEFTATANVLTHDSNDDPAGFDGCENLAFAPTLTTAPDTSKADTPAGLTVEVKPTTGGLIDPQGLGTADIQNTTVTLPAGLAINPGQAAGLEACQSYQDGVGSEGEASCPAASKVGTVQIETPLLKDKLEGNVYILQANPPNLQLLVAASADGVDLKLVGDVHLDATTGRLTATFAGTPELPFTDFKLSFSGGAQAALATPIACGTYTASSDFNAWSSPFIADAFPTASFAITSGTNGSPCPPSPLPFSPSLIAGSTTDQAGGYTDFSLLLQAPDDQQRVQRLQFKTPEGLLGMISKVPLCGEQQATQGTCPQTSQIGHTVVASGPGPYPLVVPQPGQPPAPIYLTGPYEGAPYGLSIVVPLHVGPFVLDTQIVRAKIEVDQLTAQLTVTTDPLPQIVDGVPTDLRSIDAVIDKPGFMFNPTGCSPRAFSGTAYGTEGAAAPITSPFQMGSCRALTFKPNFKASTQGKTSRANGASLNVKLLYPTTPLGANQASSQANIQSVKVELPKRLPSRLTTLQKACTAAQFNLNPAGCPAASVVGHATAVTPVLPVPLTGPAYFVSNGNEAFPNLIVVLQGYGVTVHLVGDTFISKQGITSSTFKQVPDVPISSFELTLPEGPYSALAANGNLCKVKLTMPTDFLAQNGAELDQKTPIAVTGCPKAKPAKKAAHHKRKLRSSKAKRHGKRRR